MPVLAGAVKRGRVSLPKIELVTLTSLVLETVGEAQKQMTGKRICLSQHVQKPHPSLTKTS